MVERRSMLNAFANTRRGGKVMLIVAVPVGALLLFPS